MNEEAFNRGFKYQGPVNRNPYLHGSSQFKSWDTGWRKRFYGE